jgi:hypothetical protein
MRGPDTTVVGHGRSWAKTQFLYVGSLAVTCLLLVLVFTATASAGKSVVKVLGGATTGTLGGQFNAPRGIAVNQNGTGGAAAGDFYVADSANNRIQQFNADGTFVRGWGFDVVTGGVAGFEICTATPECKAGVSGNAAGQMNSPRGLAINQATGQVFVSVSGNRRVDIYSATGTFEGAFGWGVDTGAAAFEFCTTASTCQGPNLTGASGGQFGNPPLAAPNSINMAINPANGNLVVPDPGFDRIQEFSITGSPATAATLVRVIGWDVDAAGGSGQLETCTSSAPGACKAGLNGAGNGQFENVIGIGADSNGFIYTADTGPSTRRVQRFNLSATSAVTINAPLLSGGANASLAPTDVYVNPVNDNLYVSKGVLDSEDVDGDGNTGEVNERRILQLDAVYNLADTHGVGAQVPVSNPGGISVQNSSGRLYISSNLSTSHRVYILDTAIPPTVTFDPVSFDENSATFTGTVNPQGQPTTYRFEYSTDGFATKKTAPLVAADAGDVNTTNTVEQEVVGLEPNTTYEVRLVATKAFGAGSATSAVQTFTTTATKPRILGAGVYPGGVPTRVILFAAIDPQGQLTIYHFEYGTSTAYGQSTPSESAGSGNLDQTMLFPLNGLVPDTTYHSKAVATNPSGTAESDDESFSTATPTPCPNQAVRHTAAVHLPDCRGYEMVSPINKNGGDIETAEQEAGVGNTYSSAYRQASVHGGKITFSSATAFGDAIGGHWSNQYIAIRGEASWSTHAISSRRGQAVNEFSLRWQAYPFFGGFTPDLSSAWIRDNNVNTLTADALQGYANLYRRDNRIDSYEALTRQGPFDSNPSDILSQDGDGGGNVGGPRVVGYSSDLRHQVFVASAALTLDASLVSGGFSGTKTQIYDLVDGKLHLASVLPNGLASSDNAFVGTSSAARLVETRQQMLKNAVSDDGSRIFWTAAPNAAGTGALYVRENSGEEQTASGACDEPGKACTRLLAPGPAQFWAASANGSRVLYSLGSHPNRTLHLLDLDTEDEVDIAGGSRGVVATAEDLSRVYFVSSEDLDGGGAAQAGAHNLYLYRFPDDAYTFVGLLSSDDVTPNGQGFGISVAMTNIIGLGFSNEPNPILNQTRVTPDGRYFAFMSNSAALSEAVGYDNTDVATGKADFQVYRFDAMAEELDCASCNPSGARPRGNLIVAPYAPLERRFTNFPDLRVAASIPTHEHDNYASRILSDDGNRLFFHSEEALLPRDTNGVQDVYQWQALGTGSCDSGDTDFYEQNGGCVYLISSGRDGAKSEFVDATPLGDEVFFTTDEGLDPRDPGLRDIYVAKAGGGFAIPQETAPCEGDACQSSPPPPSDPTPASSAFQGPGNPPKGKKCPKGKRKVKARNGKTRCASRKGAKRSKRANHDRRASR